jgi:plastocyanin
MGIVRRKRGPLLFLENGYHSYQENHVMDQSMKQLLPLIFLSAVATASIASDSEFTLTIKDHAFDQKEIKIPAGTKVKLLVVNKDATPAEFESKPLSREKVIPGHSTGTINIGPLKPGRYPFVEEYHENDAAAQGVIVVE